MCVGDRWEWRKSKARGRAEMRKGVQRGHGVRGGAKRKKESGGSRERVR